MNIDPTRMEAANAILATFAPGCRLEWDRGLYLCWHDGYRHEDRRLRWLPINVSSDFPTISRKVPFGGTGCCATMELTRWVRGLPVRPLRVWRYWCGPTVGMNPKAAELATAAGWPEDVPCVLCGRTLKPTDAFDHYYRPGIKPGPGCWYGTGCQTPKGGAA